MYIRPRDRLSAARSLRMLQKIIFVLVALAAAKAQIPSLGWCPEYIPMANFDMNRFLGVWYEAERYFQLSEVVSRCVTANYTKGADGKVRVSNEVTNRFTGIKRVLDGEIKHSAAKADEGKLHVKYTTIPLTPETQYSVLDTDYDNYAVLWSCSGIGPVHTQNAWLMTRERLASGEILQKAYGVLDKYKISKTFFVKTDQADCAYLAAAPEKDEKEKPVESNTVKEEEEAEKEGNSRSAIIPDAPEIIIQTRKSEIEAAEKVEAPAEDIAAPDAPVDAELPVVPAVKAVVEPEGIVVPEVKPEEVQPAAAPETVPERILKVADQVKDVLDESKLIDTIEEPVVKAIAEETKEKEVAEEPKEAVVAEEPKVKVIAEITEVKPVAEEPEKTEA